MRETGMPLVRKLFIVLFMAGVSYAAFPSRSMADQVIADDLIIQGSACVGIDCVNNENFGFDTIRLKENNTRIKFDDTSTSSGFPATDWQLTANDSASGGANKFSIEDITNAKVPFTIIGNAPSNSLYIDSSGRVGLRTSTPVLDLHIATSNTPAMRLEQNNAGGFTAQTWDVAGNEVNFFIRDVTGGSRLPFRIRPGAPTSSVDIAASGNVGIGTAAPSSALHVQRSNGTASLFVEETNGAAAQRTLATLKNNGAPQFEYTDTSTSTTWRLGMNNSGDFVINDTADLATAELRITTAGQLFVNGVGPMNTPDYVFKSDYQLMSLEKLEAFIKENGHLPNVQSASDVERNGGINLTALPVQVLEKVEELTLHTIAQQKTIDQLAQDNAVFKARLEALEKQNR